MTLRLADTGEILFIDFRDRSGAAASLDMWTINPDGSVANQENKIGGKAVAVPGDVKGLLYALETYGTMSREAVMAPAIQMAEEGFIVSQITTIEELIASYNGNLDDEDRAIVVENWPDYQEMVDTDDLGLYLK